VSKACDARWLFVNFDTNGGGEGSRGAAALAGLAVSSGRGRCPIDDRGGVQTELEEAECKEPAGRTTRPAAAAAECGETSGSLSSTGAEAATVVRWGGAETANVASVGRVTGCGGLKSRSLASNCDAAAKEEAADD